MPDEGGWSDAEIQDKLETEALTEEEKEALRAQFGAEEADRMIALAEHQGAAPSSAESGAIRFIDGPEPELTPEESVLLGQIQFLQELIGQATYQMSMLQGLLMFRNRG